MPRREANVRSAKFGSAMDGNILAVPISPFENAVETAIRCLSATLWSTLTIIPFAVFVSGLTAK